MNYEVDGIVKDFEPLAGALPVSAGGDVLAAVPLNQQMSGVAIAVHNSGANPLVATITLADDGISQTTPTPSTLSVAAAGLGYIYISGVGRPMPDSVIISAVSALGTTARTRVKATRVGAGI